MDGSKGRGGAYINQSQQALGSSIWRNQEATWCARGQINATEETVTRDRCFLNVTHRLHIRTNTNTHLQTILGLVAHLLPQLCQRLSQTSSPRKHTFIRTYPQTTGGEDMHTEEDGGQGTHADKPDNRQETLESSCYFFLLLFALSFHFGQSRWGERQTRKKHKLTEKVTKTLNDVLKGNRAPK